MPKMLLRSFTLFVILFVAVLTDVQSSDVITKSTEFIDSLITTTKISAHLCRTKSISLLKEYQNEVLKNWSGKHHVNSFKQSNLQRKLLTNQIYVVELKCNSSRDILKQAEELKLFKTPFKWILLGKIDQVRDLYFGIDSQVFVIDPESYEITTVYKYSSTNTSSLIISDHVKDYYDFSISKRKNLMQNSVKISFVITDSDSLNHLWDYRHTHIDALSKVNYILVNVLMDYLNASREFMVKSSWGYKNATTGLYSGMAGDLQTGAADLGGTPLFFTNDRIDIVDYVAATTPTYMKFIFRAPPLSYVMNIFTLPFDSSVWHYCFVMVGIVIIFIYVIVKWEWKEAKFREDVVRQRHQPDALRSNIFDVIMMEIGAITQQGTDVQPQSISGRIITIFTFTTLMFLYTSYSANIVALLQSTTDSIRTLEDLLNSRIKLGVEDIVYARYYFEVFLDNIQGIFKNAQDPIRKAIYQQKIAPKGQKSNFIVAKDGIGRVQKGFFAFHVELNTGYKIISDMFREGEKCGLKEIEYVNFIEPWLATRKNSVYKEIMKIGMKKLHESGIQTREIRKMYTTKPQCHTRGSNFGSVGMIDCNSAFFFFGIGVTLAAMLFIIELLVNKYAKIKKDNDRF